MKIGIDLGGSHIGVGLVKNDQILETRNKNFTKDEKNGNIKNIIIENIILMIEDILKANNILLEEVETIGIASPRISFKRCNS